MKFCLKEMHLDDASTGSSLIFLREPLRFLLTYACYGEAFDYVERKGLA